MWLGRMAFVQEGFSAFKENAKKTYEISNVIKGPPRHQILVRAPM